MLYNGGFENTYEELLSYYPVFYRDVFEMREILKAQGRLGDDCAAAIKRVLDNNFVASADEATITKLEKFLYIERDPGRSLEERRRLVHSYFVGFGKVSASSIRESIRALTGAGCAISFERTDDAGNNTLVIVIERGDNADINYGDIELVLSKRIPAHITYTAFVKYTLSAIAVSAGRNNHLFEYEQCGLEPEVALCGSKTEAETVADNMAESYVVDYMYCGTAYAGSV